MLKASHSQTSSGEPLSKKMCTILTVSLAHDRDCGVDLYCDNRHGKAVAVLVCLIKLAADTPTLKMGFAWEHGHVKNLHKHLHCLAWGTYLAFALSAQSYGAAPRRLPSFLQSDTQVAEAVAGGTAPT